MKFLSIPGTYWTCRNGRVGRFKRVRYCIGNILIILFSAIQIQAQEVRQSGFVRDADNQEPVIGAVIQANGFYSISNEFGYFTIQVDGNKQDTLRISHVSYQPKKFVIDPHSDSLVNIFLDVYQLEEIHVLYDHKFKTRKDQIIGSLTIDADDLAVMPLMAGETDIIKYLATQSGVAAGVEGYSQISVRGGDLFENQYYLDGIPVYNTGHFLGLTSIFNGNIIRRADFYKGSAPSQFGGRLSSVTNIETRKGNKNQWEFNGDFGILDSDVSIEGPISKKRPSSVIASSRVFYIFPLVNELQKNNDGANYYFYDFNLKANYEMSPGSKLELSYFYGQDQLRFSDISNSSTGERTQDQENQDIGNSVLSLRYFNAIKNNYFLTAYVGYTYNEGRFRNINEFSYENFSENSQQDFSAHLRDLYSRINLDILLSNNWQWKNGIESLYHTINPGNLTEIERSQSMDFLNETINTTNSSSFRLLESSVYTALEGYVGSRIKIHPGLRVSTGFSSRSFVRLEPRFSAQYELSATTLKFNAGSFNQYLHPIVYSNSEVQPMVVWLPSNHKRLPQHSDQISVGASRSFLNNQFLLNLEGYYKRYKNLSGISNVSDDFDLFINTEEYLVYGGTGRSYGIELSGEGYFFHKLKVEMYYNWMRSLRRFDSINNGQEYPFKFQREHTFGLSAFYQLTDRWQLSGNFVFNKGHRYTYPLGYVDNSLLADNYFIFNAKNNVNLPAYHRVDLGFIWNKELKDDHIFGVKFGIYNLYGRRNLVSVFPDLGGGEELEFNVKGIVILRSLPYVNLYIKKKL